MHRFGIRFFLVVVITTLTPAGVSAQNMLVNPDFDTDVTTGWIGLGVWDPSDVMGSGTSGSVTWTNTWATGGALYQYQCIEVPVFFDTFKLSGYATIPPGQPIAGQAYISVDFYSDPNCSNYMSGFDTPNLYTASATWHLLEISGFSPAGFVSVRVGVRNHKDQAGDFQVFHDAVFFGPDNGFVFGDGFETGDVSEWDWEVGAF